MKAAIGGMGERIGSGARRVWGAVRRRPLLAVLALPAAVVLYVAALYPFTPSIGDIRKSKQESPSVVLSADGKELAVFKRANRDWVKLEDISPKAIEALLATEDHRFYEHNGIDLKRTAKAVLNTLKGDVEGGSTLTQQLARNLYPEEIGREQTVTRKVKEAITALKIEAIYSKDEILESYLNSVSFLYNAWGIESASRTYFQKPAKQLNELEAATLVGMLKGTSYYNPVLNPERALQRRNIVLSMMVRHDKLPDAQYQKLKEQPLKLDFERLPEFNGPAPHLAEHLRRWLIDWADKHDYNIYADGLVVRTTIDSRLQAAANESVRRQGEALQGVADAEWSRSGTASYGINPTAYAAAAKGTGFDYFWNSRKDLVDTWVRDSGEFRALREQGRTAEDALKELKGDTQFMAKLRKDKTTLQAGFLALEPHTGHVKAWVGSRDYNEDKFDHVQQARRQPGSTFKPFVYGAAFEMGIPAGETLVDAPVAIQIDKNQVWRPGDVGAGPTNQPMTLREGLARSKNTITAQLMMRVGPSRVANLARAMGVRQSKLQEVPSLALGTSPVTLKEMVTAFGTIANGGNYIAPVLVTAIEDRDKNVLESFGGQASEPALSNEAAMTLLDSLRGTIEFGSAVGLRQRFGLTGDLAGKTGTTQDNTDGWFILMHPQLVAGAWMGFNDNRVTMRSEYWGQGAHNAAFVVGDFMQESFKGKVLDAKAVFAAPRYQDTEKPLMQQMGDWWNSVFSTPPSGQPETAVVSVPANGTIISPSPSLEPAPRSIDVANPAPLGSAPAYAPPPPPDAPVIVEPQRVPSFPRPLETARPADSVPGTQVYRTPESRIITIPATSSMGSGGGSASSGSFGGSASGSSSSTGSGSSSSGTTVTLTPRPATSSGGSSSSSGVTYTPAPASSGSSASPASSGSSSGSSPAPSTSTPAPSSSAPDTTSSGASSAPAAATGSPNATE